MSFGDFSLENYLFYLRTVRAIWGKGVNLKPLGGGELRRIVV